MIVKIANKIIGDNNPIFIIAELSCNHLQDFKLAIKTIKAIKKAGADAVKLQTYTPDTMTIKSGKKHFKINQGTIWDGQTLYDLYREAYTPWEWQPKLKKIAEELGLIFFSTPFDRTAVDFLEKINVPAYKIASFEITDIPLIEYVASKHKPVILSTGIATLQEIREAIDACKRVKNEQIAILKCTSAYPTPMKSVHLKTLLDIKKRFNAVIGVSDHTLGITVPITSVALGAQIIEKHFILEKKLGGPDAKFSLDPQEFKGMVRAIREAELAVGEVNYELEKSMSRNREFARSIFVVKNIQRGQVFTQENIRVIRPNFGIAPKFISKVIGKKATRNIAEGVPLAFSDVEGFRNR